MAKAEQSWWWDTTLKNKHIFIIAIALAAIAADSMLLLSPPVSWKGGWWEFHIPLAALTFMTVMNVGAAVLFVSNLHVYKAGLRRAYQAIAFGIIFIGIGSLQLPIINGFDLWATPWVRSGGIGLPFIFSGLIFYFGTRALGRLTGVKGIPGSVLLPIGVSIVGMALVIAVPHASTTAQEIGFDIANAISTFNGVFLAAGALLALVMSRHIGKHYARAMRWLFLGAASGAAIPFLSVLHVLATGVKNAEAPDLLLLFVVNGVLLLIAGHAFAQTKDYSVDQLVTTDTTANQSAGTAALLDSITSLAGLVSNPASIDTTLDELRTITAGLNPGQTPTAEDTDSLQSIYLDVEDYLMSRDPIRTFQKSELRSHLAPAIRKQIEAYELKKGASVAKQHL